MAVAKLQHLVVAPCFGLCNRIRVIAAAKRLCEMSGARCTLVWDWPDFESFFEPEPAIEIVPRFPDFPEGSFQRLEPMKERRPVMRQRISLDGPSRVVIATCFPFGGPSDLHYLGMDDLLAWLPTPARHIREKARLFREKMFPLADIVGLHLRRTDAIVPVLDSPTWKFFHQARAIVAAGKKIYLATDNHKTESAMRARFGDHILLYPKNPAMARRWPRSVDLAESIEDYVDLLLLSSCDYVLGSHKSSYSELAIALNGSPHSTTVERLPTGRMTSDDRRQALRDEIAKIPRRVLRLRSRIEPGIGIGRVLRRLARGVADPMQGARRNRMKLDER